MTSEDLRNILDNLNEHQLRTFQWFLKQPNIVQGLPAIKEYQLQTPNRCKTVDVMVQTYGLQKAVQVTRVVLEKISRKDLLQRLPASSSGPEVHVSDVGETSENREPSSSQTQPPLPQNKGVSEVKLEPNTADPKLDPNQVKIPSIFTPEMQTESRRILYRFRCTDPGEFQCAETGLVFVLTQGAELQYSIVQWDESLLKPTGKVAAGPLYDIRCSEDAAVRQLHFPHCETKDALSIDGLLSVAHFTDDGMSILKPLQITDTHVVVEITHLSLFGIIWDSIQRWLSTPVKGQVLLFLRPPVRGPRTLDVFLLQKNIPPSQVTTQKENAEYIEISANCSLIIGERYSLRCKPKGLKIQPERENFERDFGPHFHPTFEVFLETNTDKVTLTVQDHKDTDVWKRLVHLKGVSEVKLEPNTADPKLDPNQVKGAMMTSEDLKNILDDLDDEELHIFQWFLQKPNIVQGLPAIPKSRLQTLDRCNTVDVMVQTYGDQKAVQVTRVVLEKISRNDLLQRLPASSSGPEG